mmetsp:Transcript_24796/g.86330  ORF Transcript_24796/g.86330 Transcript_24796/m.86330 type:complete len:214 (+) Transcript_24796:898-1539(+)
MNRPRASPSPSVKGGTVPLPTSWCFGSSSARSSGYQWRIDGSSMPCSHGQASLKSHTLVVAVGAHASLVGGGGPSSAHKSSLEAHFGPRMHHTCRRREEPSGPARHGPHSPALHAGSSLEQETVTPGSSTHAPPRATFQGTSLDADGGRVTVRPLPAYAGTLWAHTGTSSEFASSCATNQTPEIENRCHTPPPLTLRSQCARPRNTGCVGDGT